MPDKKIIAVTGATGAQGDGVVRAILNDPNGGFAVRAITRNVNSNKAKELAKLGAEVVAGDIDNPESMKKAFAGAYGAYCVTFYWAHMSPEREVANGITLAHAAKEANLQHVVWSTLEDTRKWIPVNDTRMPTLFGKYNIPHFDAKGEVDQEFTKLGLPVTFLLTTFYWDNFIYFGMGPKKGPDGKYALTVPMGDKKLAGIAAEDIGKCAYGVFKAGAKYLRKYVGIAGELVTGAQMAAAFSNVLGQEVRYFAVSPDLYRSYGFPGANDLGNMFQFYAEFEDHFIKTRDPGIARTLNPQLQNFTTWLEKNKSLIPLR